MFFVFTSTSCSTVKVRTLHGKLTRESIESARELRMLDEDAGAEDVEETAVDCLSLLREARRFEWRGQTARAAGCYLHSAIYAREELAARSLEVDTRKKLLQLHNFSLARFVEYWIGNGRDGGDSGDTFFCGNTRFDVSTGKDSYYKADYFDRAVSSVSVKGKGVVKKRRDGIGASLVGVRNQSPDRAEEMEFFFRRGLHVPVSAVIENVSGSRAGGRSVEVSFLNPLVRTSYEYGGFEYAVAADFSSPVEMLASGENELLLGLAGFFLAAVKIEESGIFLAEPYDPDRIPVVLTHGLVSSPMIWRDIIPHMAAEDDLSERYQFMLFAYPSSLTIPESARLFRECLADLREKYDPEGSDPLSRNMVGVGHSMGGVLTHLLVAEMGDNLWNQFSDVPFADFEFPPGAREDVRTLAFFEPDPAINRAVYYSTPHGGATLAELRAANVVSRLAKLPSGFLDVTTTVFEIPFQKDVGVKLGKKMTSVQSLQPDSPIVEALNLASYKPGVVYHSIIGDRGKGDTPGSSDGVVEYWSSHQDGAASELIVPTGHRSYEDSKAIEELERILRLHAGLIQR